MIVVTVAALPSDLFVDVDKAAARAGAAVPAALDATMTTTTTI